jgi:hypothetical protein
MENDYAIKERREYYNTIDRRTSPCPNPEAPPGEMIDTFRKAIPFVGTSFVADLEGQPRVHKQKNYLPFFKKKASGPAVGSALWQRDRLVE